MKRLRFCRRPFILSAATCLPLPFLPSLVRADSAAERRRFVVWFTPNGYMRDRIVPGGTGPGYELLPTLEPLAERGVREKVSLVSGLQRGDADHAIIGAHAFLTGAFITCTKVDRNGARAGNPSADQVVAPMIRCEGDRFESLRFGMGMNEDVSDATGPFSETYLKAISYSPDPLVPQGSPQRAFDDLMVGSSPAASSEEAEQRVLTRRSVLDFALGRLRSLERRLSSEDRMRLQAYTDEVRSIEQRVMTVPDDPSACGGTRPAETSSYSELMDIWIDLQVMALQCGLTNTLTFMSAPGGSHRIYRELGANRDHHNAYSHKESSDWRTHLAAIERWQVDQFAKFLSRLDAVVEADGTTILDKSVVLLGSEINDGNIHDHENMPLLLAGGAGGGLSRMGEHFSFRGQPVARLLLAAMRAVGADVSSFAGRSEAFDL